jgi:outer membrane protein
VTKLFITIFTVLLIINTSAIARVLTLDDALNIAIAQNKNIQIAKSDRQFADTQVKEAWSSALPNIAAGITYNHNFRDNFFFITATDSSGKRTTTALDVTFRNQFNFNATLSQTIYSFGKVGTALDVAYDFKDFSDFQYTAQEQAILTQVKKAFYQALLFQKVWEVAKESEQSAKENYDNVNIRFESGMVSEFDLLQADVRWQNAIPLTLEAHKNAQLAMNNLKSLLTLPIEDELSLSWDIESYPRRPDNIDVSVVFQNRPAYRARLLEKSMREKNIKIEFANHLPTLLGNVGYTYAASSDAFQLENRNDNVFAGLSLNIPIYSGGFTSAQVQKARIEVDKISKQVELEEDNIRIELSNVYLRMDEAMSKIEAANKSVSSAKRAFEIAESRTNNGLATQLELKDSRIFLDQARITYISSIYSYLEAYFDWELLTGIVTYTGKKE